MLELIEELLGIALDLALDGPDDPVLHRLRLLDIKAEVGAWPRSASFQTADGWCGCLRKSYQHKVTPQCGTRPMPPPPARPADGDPCLCAPHTVGPHPRGGPMTCIYWPHSDPSKTPNPEGPRQ
jgi:hypothetical protein